MNGDAAIGRAMSYGVVIVDGGTPLTILGPRETREQAVALSEVLRLGALKAYVVPLRDAGPMDIHGPEVFTALLGSALDPHDTPDV